MPDTKPVRPRYDAHGDRWHRPAFRQELVRMQGIQHGVVLIARYATPTPASHTYCGFLHGRWGVFMTKSNKEIFMAATASRPRTGDETAGTDKPDVGSVCGGGNKLKYEVSSTMANEARFP